MSAKNILFASWYTGMGGGETDLLTLARTLDPDRYRPHLLVPQEGKLTDAWRKNGWQVHIIPFRGASTYFIPAVWKHFPIAKKIASLIHTQQIDLVHSDYHTLPFCVGACERTHTPLLWVVWGWWFQPKVWQRAFFKPLKGIARSKSIRDGFLGNPPFMPTESLPIIYTGVDTQRFRPHLNGDALRTEWHIPLHAPVITMIARFQDVKGHDVFQAMARHVLAQFPLAHFVVAGEETFGVSADQAYRDKILAQAKADSRLSTQLHYVGFRSDVERVIAASDMVVCASDFESYGFANLEAMACAKPVVSTNRGGPAETILDGETGYLVQPRAPEQLAERVITLLKSPSEQIRMGENGRRHVESHFSTERAKHAYETLFNTLLKR